MRVRASSRIKTKPTEDVHNLHGLRVDPPILTRRAILGLELGLGVELEIQLGLDSGLDLGLKVCHVTHGRKLDSVLGHDQVKVMKVELVANIRV